LGLGGGGGLPYICFPKTGVAMGMDCCSGQIKFVVKCNKVQFISMFIIVDSCW